MSEGPGAGTVDACFCGERPALRFDPTSLTVHGYVARDGEVAEGRFVSIFRCVRHGKSGERGYRVVILK